MMSRALSVSCLVACAAAAASPAQPPDDVARGASQSPVLSGAPIWSGNGSASFALLRAPDFALRAWPVTSARLLYTSAGSPRPPAGTTQAKLLGAAALWVNGVLVGAGPGHAVPTAAQPVRAADVRPFLRGGGAANALGVASFFARNQAQHGDAPGVQAVLEIVDGAGAYNVSATGGAWTAWEAADAYYNPTGDAGISWYPMPNEMLDRRVFPAGWAEPGFSGGAGWAAAAPAPAWRNPLYFEPGPPPVALVRSACAVTAPAPGVQIIDFGQEFMGGVNLTLTGAAGARVSVVVGEELMPGGGAVRSPLRTGNRWNSTWTLSGVPALDAGIVQHEFIQFRYAQVTGAVAPLTPATARAWVIQHPAGGDGANPFEHDCSRSTPATTAWGAAGAAPARTPLGAVTSSSSALNTVWSFCAYSIVATSLDVNVDGQTRERDVDVVDALNTALGQFYIFSPGDYSVSERTALEIFTNDTGIWSQWYDFKASAVMLAAAHALYTGNTALPARLWSDNDASITSTADDRFASLQFYAGLRYVNASGNGLLHFDKSGACGGSWACEPLVDWPTTTRDGYDCTAANNEDTVRSALGAMAVDSLARIADWLGKPPAAARYHAAAAGVRAALAQHALRPVNASGAAFFVDGQSGAPAVHAAVHSTLYAVAAGGADAADAAVAKGLVAYLDAHGVPPSSCMMGRWWIEALYRLGVSSPAAADLALQVLTAATYPSWIDMLAQGATVTTEAWRAADKNNMDFAHPWCASPSFTIPAGTLGVIPTSPGWATWHAWPQPSSLTALAADIPSPAGMIHVAWMAPAGARNATLTLSVLTGQAASVCLPAPGTAAEVAAAAPAAPDALIVDGTLVPVPGVLGRFLCTVTDLPPGEHVVSRIVAA